MFICFASWLLPAQQSLLVALSEHVKFTEPGNITSPTSLVDLNRNIFRITFITAR